MIDNKEIDESKRGLLRIIGGIFFIFIIERIIKIYRVLHKIFPQKAQIKDIKVIKLNSNNINEGRDLAG